MAHTQCPDCGAPLQAIKLTDATERWLGEGSFRVDQKYSAEDATSNFGGIFGGVQPEGSLYGRLCPQCGRILLYAVPMNSSSQTDKEHS